MKKMSKVFPLVMERFKEFWLRFKFISLILFLTTVCSLGTIVPQLDKKLYLEMSNVELREVLLAIEKQTPFMFMYNKQDVDKVGRLNVNVSGDNLEKILDECLEGTGLYYEIREDVVVIKPKPLQQEEIKRLTIRGKVFDKDKNPIPGVSVLLKGSNVGVSTNVTGEYSLSIPESEDIVLVFSFVGMKTIEVRYRNNPVIDVTMEEDKVELEDVVITGYANIRKSSFTGTATQVKKEDILNVGATNIIDILQVFDPSLRIMKNNEMGSDPNTLPEFYVRGRSGIPGVKELDAFLSDDISEFALTNNPNLPVFILDGFEVSVEKIYDFDINRIKDITILKDAAATAIYGSRASNGVVVIETVPPKPGELIVSYSGNYAITAPDLTSYNLMNTKEKIAAEVAADLFEPWNTSPSNYANEKRSLYWYYLQKKNRELIGVDNYWLSQPLQTEFNHKHSLYVEGGSDLIRFGVELRYDNQNGVMKESFRDRVGAGLTLDYRYKGLQVKNQISYDYIRAKDSPYGSFRDYTNKHPYDYWEDENGNLLENLQQWGNGLATPLNPLYEASLGSFDKNGYKEWTNNLSVHYYFTPFFFIKAQFALSYKDAWSKSFVSPLSPRFETDDDWKENNDWFLRGELTETGNKTSRWNLNVFGSYNQLIGLNNINASAGLNLTSTDYKYNNAMYRGFPDGERSSPAYAYEIVRKPTFTDNKTRLSGGFVTVNYSYNDIYLFDGSFRFDGSSEFGSDRKWAPFWSIGTGVNIHNYSFVKSVGWLDSFRVTVNTGETGKTNFQPYVARNTFEILLDDWYSTGLAASLKYMGNSSLTWEKQVSWNFKTEFTVFSKATFKFDYYHKKTIDLVTEVSIPSSSGFSKYTDNIGEILNKGFEIDVNLNVYNSQDWSIRFFGNLAHNKNEILKISESLKQYNDKVDDFYHSYKDENILTYVFQKSKENEQYTKSFMKYEKGSSLTSIYAMKSIGINPANGKEVFLRRDGTITYDWDSSEQQKVGDTEPWAQGAFGLNVRWRNFSLYTTFLYEWGGEAYNHTLVTQVENANILYYNADKRVLTDRWKEVGDITPLKAIQDRYYATRPTSRFVQKNNNLVFNSLTVGYDFSRNLLKKIKINTLRLQFNMKDIATASTIKQEMGLSYPYARTFTFSLNTTF